MKKFLAKTVLCAALLLSVLIAILAIRTALWEGRVAAALAIRESTHTLCVGNSHTGCTWEDSEADGVQVVWKSACPIPFAWMRLAEIERRGGFKNVRLVVVDACMPACDMDEDDMLRCMAEQWPLAWRYLSQVRVSVTMVLRRAFLPILRSWDIGNVPPPNDDRLWIKLSPEQQHKECENGYTVFRSDAEQQETLKYLGRIRDICRRNNMDLCLFFAPLPMINPQRNFDFLNHWKSRLESDGYTVYDLRSASFEEEFRDAHHLNGAGRARITREWIPWFYNNEKLEN